MWLIIIVVVLIIFAIFTTDAEFTAEIIVISVVAGLVAWFIISVAAEQTTYHTQPIQLQAIDGEYLVKQGDEYAIKYNDQVHVVDVKNVHVIQSDSTYEERKLKMRNTNVEAVDRWLPGKNVNDTMWTVLGYNLYRDLN